MKMTSEQILSNVTIAMAKGHALDQSVTEQLEQQVAAVQAKLDAANKRVAELELQVTALQAAATPAVAPVQAA